MKEITNTQPPAKWIRDIYNNHEYLIFYYNGLLPVNKSDYNNYVSIPQTLKEQLQSEAEEKGYRKKLPPHLNTFIDEQIKEKIEEAREQGFMMASSMHEAELKEARADGYKQGCADERKKIIAFLKEGINVNSEGLTDEEYGGYMFAISQLEQPVEERK